MVARVRRLRYVLELHWREADGRSSAIKQPPNMTTHPIVNVSESIKNILHVFLKFLAKRTLELWIIEHRRSSRASVIHAQLKGILIRVIRTRHAGSSIAT